MGDGDLGVRGSYFKKSELVVYADCIVGRRLQQSKRLLSCPWVRWTHQDYDRYNHDRCEKENLNHLHSANMVKYLLWASPGGKN